MENKIKSIDWELYIERQQPLYLFAAFIRPYGEYLKESTGFEFKNQLLWFKGDTGIFYRSKKEMEAADKYYLELIRRNDERLALWSEEGLKQNKLADELIKKFQGSVSVEEIQKDYLEIQKQTEQIMLYGTVIPYRILSAINYAIDNEEAKQEDFKHAMELFEPLRAVTRYPQMVEIVYRTLWRAAMKIIMVTDEELFSLTTPQELEEIFSSEKANEKIIKQRKEGCVFWLADDGKNIEFNYEKDFLSSIGIKSFISEDVKEFKGSIANKGCVQGKVRIINKIEDVKDFTDGDIVVSINTSPSLMPVLIKCGGIITDEGGIMCHAAIVSRELNKPCIIGTKIATKILKDGMQIEVDADNGVVKILGK